MIQALRTRECRGGPFLRAFRTRNIGDWWRRWRAVADGFFDAHRAHMAENAHTVKEVINLSASPVPRGLDFQPWIDDRVPMLACATEGHLFLLDADVVPLEFLRNVWLAKRGTPGVYASASLFYRDGLVSNCVLVAELLSDGSERVTVHGRVTGHRLDDSLPVPLSE